jgi:hypothetical protein
VFQRLRFQNLVERMFDRKIVAVQTDWGGEYKKLKAYLVGGHSLPRHSMACHRLAAAVLPTQYTAA